MYPRKENNHHLLPPVFLLFRNLFILGITLGCVPSVAGGSIRGVLTDPETNRDLQSSSVTDFTDPKTVVQKEESTTLLRFPPGIRNVILNIGANTDPILPRAQDGPCTMAVAVEPMVSHLIKPHPRLQVIPAAITSSPGLATMVYMNNVGASSSLSPPGSKSGWNSDPERDGAIKFVPVLSLRNLLDSIPSDVKIDFLKTDMQGHDFAAISASGDALAQRQIPRVWTEAWYDDVSSYQGVHNDLCRDWIPFMESIGYELVGLDNALGTIDLSHYKREDGVTTNVHMVKNRCAHQLAHAPDRPPFQPGLNELDALWRLKSVVSEENDSVDLYHYRGVLFTPEEYASCGDNESGE